jgi:hypothetical protein
MSASFHLGNQTTSYVNVEVLQITNPSAVNDYYEGNWVRSLITVAAGPWNGSIEATLRTEDFTLFRTQLQRLYEEVDAPPARFDSMEPWLEFEVERSDRLGHVRVMGQARAEPFFEKHNILQFVIDIDHTYLPATLAELREITNQFPVLASPKKQR